MLGDDSTKTCPCWDVWRVLYANRDGDTVTQLEIGRLDGVYPCHPRKNETSQSTNICALCTFWRVHTTPFQYLSLSVMSLVLCQLFGFSRAFICQEEKWLLGPSLLDGLAQSAANDALLPSLPLQKERDCAKYTLSTLSHKNEKECVNGRREG